jgi:hypothetical protein
VHLEGLGQLKNLITSSGVEPATFRLVVITHVKQRLSDSEVTLLKDSLCLTISKTFKTCGGSLLRVKYVFCLSLLVSFGKCLTSYVLELRAGTPSSGITVFDKV